MFDLHMHSNFSDGDHHLFELVDFIKERGLKFVALTDHNTTKGVGTFQRLAKKHNIKAVSGVEIDSEINNYGIHILGIGIDPQNENLQKLLKPLAYSFKNRAKIITKKAGKLYGTKLSIKDSYKESRNPLGITGVQHVSRALFKKYPERFEEILNEKPDRLKIQGLMKLGAPLFTDVEKAPYKKVIRVIQKAGGTAIIAHPNHNIPEEHMENFLQNLIEVGLQGIEAFNSKGTEKEIDRNISLGKKYHLLITAGSDFHSNVDKNDNREVGKINFYGYDIEKINYNINKHFFREV